MARTITVVIPTAGRPDLLDRTLDSLCQCQKPEEYESTIVVENGGREGAEQIVETYAKPLNARYMYSEEANKSAALNLVLNSLTETLIVFFDDDVRISPNTLVAYRDAADGIESGVIFGGPVDVDYEAPPPEWLRAYLPVSARGWGLNGIEGEKKLRFLGSNWAAFSTDLKKAGGFNPQLGPGNRTTGTGQETEMQIRLESIGIEKVFIPDAKVWHYVPCDRCSEEFVLNRAYRDGLSHGARRAHDAFTVFGLEPWMYVEYLNRSVKLLIKMPLGRRIRFGGYRNLIFHRGLMHGYKNAQPGGG